MAEVEAREAAERRAAAAESAARRAEAEAEESRGNLALLAQQKAAAEQQAAQEARAVEQVAAAAHHAHATVDRIVEGTRTRWGVRKLSHTVRGAAEVCAGSCSSGHSTTTAMRVCKAAKEAAHLVAKGGMAAAEVVRSNARGNLSLDAALTLSGLQGQLDVLVKQLDVNAPDVLASSEFARDVQREYLERRHATEWPHAVSQWSVAALDRSCGPSLPVLALSATAQLAADATL